MPPAGRSFLVVHVVAQQHAGIGYGITDKRYHIAIRQGRTVGDDAHLGPDDEDVRRQPDLIEIERPDPVKIQRDDNQIQEQLHIHDDARPGRQERNHERDQRRQDDELDLEDLQDPVILQPRPQITSNMPGKDDGPPASPQAAVSYNRRSRCEDTRRHRRNLENAGLQTDSRPANRTGIC